MYTNGCHKGRILIAEASAEVPKALMEILRAEGYLLLQTENGFQALEILRQDRVDFAVLDEQLPGVSGLEVLQQCNRLGVRIPVVLLTTGWNVNKAVAAMKAGAQNYLTKPVNPREVLEELRNALDPQHSAASETMPDQLRQAQKLEAVGRLAGGVVHDFNNLLTVILGYSDLLRDVTAEPIRSYALEIAKAAEEGTALTAQLLAFSRTQVVEPTILDLNEVIRHGDSLLRRFLGDHVKLRTELDPTLGAIRADASQINQVIMNLAINARDAMPAGGTLTIRTEMFELEAPVPAWDECRLDTSDYPPTPLKQECDKGKSQSCEARGEFLPHEGARGTLKNEAVTCLAGPEPRVRVAGAERREAPDYPLPTTHHPLPLAPGSYIVLTVEDTGHGMDSTTLTRLFEPFFTTKRQGQGTGLGLATVQNIVRQWGGYITVASELAHGTRFTIFFPQVPSNSPLTTHHSPLTTTHYPPPTTHYPLLVGCETVLLLEDEPAVRTMLRVALETNGYTVLEANSPDEALYFAAEYRGPIHLFISDLLTPHTLGTDLAKRALQTRKGLNILFVAGHSNNALVELVLQQGHGVVLQKPFTTDALLAKVREALQQPG